VALKRTRALKRRVGLSSGILRTGSIAMRQLSQADPKPTGQIGSELKRLTTAGAEYITTESTPPPP